MLEQQGALEFSRTMYYIVVLHVSYFTHDASPATHFTYVGMPGA